jgi:hypothetical protein
MLDTAIAAGNEELMDVLLNKFSILHMIDEEILRTAASQGPASIVRRLLDRLGEIMIPEEVVLAAASNKKYGGQVIQLLFERLGHRFPITQAILGTVSANKDSSSNPTTITLLVSVNN